MRMGWAQRLKPINLAMQEAEIWRIMVQDQSRKKVHETPHLNQWLGMVACVCHPSYCREA
jgi:hypothetical protein